MLSEIAIQALSDMGKGTLGKGTPVAPGQSFEEQKQIEEIESESTQKGRGAQT